MQITRKDNELRFEIRAKPRAKRSAIGDPKKDVLLLAIAAPPIDGAANEEIVRILANALRVPKRNIRIAHGEGGKNKLIAVVGLDEAELHQRLSVAHAAS